MNFFSNRSLLVVVGASLAIQVWSHHSVTLATFLKTSLISLSNCLVLLAISAIPLLTLEVAKTYLLPRARK